MLRIAIYLIIAMILGCSGNKSPTQPVDPVGGYTPAKIHNWDLTKIVPLDSVRAMAQGQKMYVRTAFMGPELDDFEVRLITVLDDFMPPIPLILLEASDPRLVKLGGVASGMSGSPLITEKGVAGALSYSPGLQTGATYYFMATSIESMLSGIFDEEIAPAGKIGKVNGMTFEPITLSVTGTSINHQFLDAIINLGSDNRWSTNDIGSANASDDIEQTFVPGSPLAVAIVTGDEVSLSNVGTLTYMAPGGRIVGFGHQMSLVGKLKTGWPIIPARIVAEISCIDAPYKLATLGKSIAGSIFFDQRPGIGGYLGVTPTMIPLKMTAYLPNGETHVFDHQIVASGIGPYGEATYGGYALFNPIAQRLNYKLGYSIRTVTRISFGPGPRVERRRLYANPSALSLNLLLSAVDDYRNNYIKLTNHPDKTTRPEWVDITLSVVDSVLAGNIIRIDTDTSVVAGSVLTVQSTLRMAKGEYPDRVEEFNLTLPNTLPAGVYTLTINSGENEESQDPSQDPDVPDELLPDTSMVDVPTWEQILAQINDEDKKTILSLCLTLSRITEPGVSDEIYIPDDIPTPITERRDLGIIITGQRMREVRVVKH